MIEGMADGIEASHLLLTSSSPEVKRKERKPLTLRKLLPLADLLGSK